jgi:hypothetical protein
MISQGDQLNAESLRLTEDEQRLKNWKRWGPYLSERQWGTVREDYSSDGNAWDYFTHDQARSRAYRWGEDGLLGITDRECRLCFALALWNGKDPILKERLFGLTNSQGNHGEDVKECYFFLDATPTNSYLKGLYKYPQDAFPYDWLVNENRRRGKHEAEFELIDTRIFDQHRYFDVLVEYAKAAPNDLLVRITASNRGPAPALLHLLPTLWFRNTWAWGREEESAPGKPRLQRSGANAILADHETLGRFGLVVGPGPDGRMPPLLFTENDSNVARLFGGVNPTPFVKDAFHEYVIHDRCEAVNPANAGTKAAAHYVHEVPAGGNLVVQLRLFAEKEAPPDPLGPEFRRTFADRIAEADQFYRNRIPDNLTLEETRVARQAYAGLLWSKQFYSYVVQPWLEGDPAQPPPDRRTARNDDWVHLYNRDIISMPDTWEYPWYANWDLAFHLIALAEIDITAAKQQLLLFLREWYMHPNGQLPAYEWNLGDVNPPVHAWACWRVYKKTGPKGQRDRLFLARTFHKLLINFTWWVNRKDVTGKNLFGGGFLGLDNIGPFDRSQPLPDGALLTQADGTAWMAFYCLVMLSMALELADENSVYEDVASKFFEHFIAIADAMHTLGGLGLWDPVDGFYYDGIQMHGANQYLRTRSMVGLIPLFAVTMLEDEVIGHLPGFKKRLDWFVKHRQDLSRHIAYCEHGCGDGKTGLLLAIPSRERLVRVLRHVLDENQFLSPYGIRSMSRCHRDHPYIIRFPHGEFRVDYDPGESTTGMFGGNSNWRGPIWMPVNYLLVEALQRYHYFYGDSLKVEYPTGSARMLNLLEISNEIALRLVRLFLPDEQDRRPGLGAEQRFAADPYWRDLLLFYEYFHGDTGRGCGASHQTGWTALVVRLLEKFVSRPRKRATKTQALTSPVPLAASS